MPLTKYDEQTHIANEKRWSYEDGFEDGFEGGRKIGRIQEFIEIKSGFGIAKDIILQEIQEKFSIDQQQAQKYVEKFL